MLLQELDQPVLHLETYADEMQGRRYSVYFHKVDERAEPEIRWEYLGAPPPFA